MLYIANIFMKTIRSTTYRHARPVNKVTLYGYAYKIIYL